ncbi:hypothetical protein CBR_g52687 [Chara braunii]|uniref:Uncharacterized protein n=1 Tax=Chara braunii TaxID=69332 RepID=A0A388MAP5_CHABU|nr:hypothetical protein CBR_g52687 [Chara braunii]|eukprot:GBG91651.1 hypothetical protein CBR_g52687 [Chara braunii]
MGNDEHAVFFPSSLQLLSRGSSDGGLRRRAELGLRPTMMARASIALLLLLLVIAAAGLTQVAADRSDENGDRHGGDRPGGDRPGGDRPGGDRPGGDRPGGDRPGEGSGSPRQCPGSFTNYPVCNLQGDGCTKQAGMFVGNGGGGTRVRLTGGPNDCCAECAADSNCFFWTWTKVSGPAAGNMCDKFGNAFLCDGTRKSWMPISDGSSVSGGSCGVSGRDDPHFVGADGVHFDFSGEPHADFCLVADRHLHVNMHLSGYYDSVADADVNDNGVEATDVAGTRSTADHHGQSAVHAVSTNVTRTWIRALGIRFKTHAIALEARSDGNPDRLDGYMAKIEVDGELVTLTPGSEKRFGDGIRLAQTDVTHFSGYEQDNYVVSIEGVLEISLRLRSAGAKWQRADDAQTHFNINVRQLAHSDDVHGVLGQTYRPQAKRTGSGSYRLVKGFLKEYQVEGPNGDGYLEGAMDDYRTTGLLATDCKFAIFQRSGMDAADARDSQVTFATKETSYGVALERRR